MVGKRNQEYSQMVHYVRVEVVIAVVQANSLFVAAGINSNRGAPSLVGLP